MVPFFLGYEFVFHVYDNCIMTWSFTVPVCCWICERWFLLSSFSISGKFVFRLAAQWMWLSLKSGVSRSKSVMKKQKQSNLWWTSGSYVFVPYNNFSYEIFANVLNHLWTWNYERHLAFITVSKNLFSCVCVLAEMVVIS